jgi:hypothetical protein
MESVVAVRTVAAEGSPAEQKVVDHFIGDLVGNHVTNDVRGKINRSVNREGLMSLDFEQQQTVPSMISSEDVSPYAIPSAPLGRPGAG